MNTKRIIVSIITGTAALFTAQAQEAPPTERSPETAMQYQDTVPSGDRVEIDQSQLPPEVRDNFEQSEYRDMDIVTAYEVNASEADSTQMQDTTSSSAGTSSTTADTASMDTTSARTEEAATQIEAAINESATGMEQSTPDLAGGTTEDVAADTTVNDLANGVEPASSNTAREKENIMDETATEMEEAIDNSAQAVGDTTIDELDGGEEIGSSAELTSPVDSAALSASPQDDTTTAEMSEEQKEAQAKEMYENNQYDNYTEANSDAYQKVAEEQLNDGAKQYELQVKGENEEFTLIYDENGNLVKTRKSSM